MFYQLLFLAAIIFLVLLLKKQNALALILMLLPFQSFLKSCFNLFAGGSGLMAMWKEIGFLLLLLKVLADIYARKDVRRLPEFPLLLCALFVLSATILFALSPDKSSALTSYKNLAFPLICFFTVAHLKFDDVFSLKIIRYIMAAALLVFAVSHAQQYLLKYEFAFFMNLAESVSSAGEIVFSQTASKIMGLDRMYGPFAGPNELGLYASLIVILSFYVLFISKQRTMKYDKLFFLIVFIAGVLTLLQTFSRVSWAVSAAAVLLLSLRSGFKKSMAAFVVFPIVVFALYQVSISFFPDVGEVFTSSVRQEEASAMDRPHEFFYGLGKIMENPVGYGLGTVQYGSHSQVFHTEIFWWLVFGETGVIIGFMYLLIYLTVFFNLLKINKIHSNLFNCVSHAVLFCAVLAGFGSVIIFEPIFQVYLWSFIGLGHNNYINKVHQ